MRRPVPLLFLLLGLVTAGAAQWLLVSLPNRPTLPAGWSRALQPVWPHPGPVVGAIVLFLVGSVSYSGALRRILNEPLVSTVTVRFAESGRRRKLPIILAGGGLAIYIWVLVQLWRRPAGPAHGGWFLISLVLISASLILSGRPMYRPWHSAASLVLRYGPEGLYTALWVAVFVWLNASDAGGWRYSSIGDEYAFYLAGAEVAAGEPFGNLFSQSGVYGIIPVMSSRLQGTLMRAIGTDAVGWKIASMLPAAIALSLVYPLARTLFGRRVATLALPVLATSHYLLGYAHTGYPNLEPLLPTVACLLLLVLGVRRQSRFLLATAGLVAGLGWYTFYSSRSAIAILAVWVVAMVRPSSWSKVWSVVVVGFVAMLLPLVAVSGRQVIEGMLQQSAVSNRSEFVSNRVWLPVWNAGRSLLAYNYNTHDGPYVLGSLAEPITAALLVLGLAYVACGLHDVRNRLVLGWFVVAIVVTGVLAKYDYVAVSRLHYALPVVAILAAVALDRGVGAVEQLWPTARRWWSAVIAGVAVLAIVGSNLHRWFVQAPHVLPSSADAVAIRIVEDPRCQGAAGRPLIVDVDIGGAIPPALQARKPAVMPEFALYRGSTAWLDTVPRRCVIFRSPDDESAVMLMATIRARWPGSAAVEERDLSRARRIQVYYPSLHR